MKRKLKTERYKGHNIYFTPGESQYLVEMGPTRMTSDFLGFFNSKSEAMHVVKTQCGFNHNILKADNVAEYVKAQKLLEKRGFKNDDSLRRSIIYWLDKGKTAKEISELMG